MHESQTLNDFILKHCNQSIDKALSAERYPSWKRLCPELQDIDFIHLGLLRCISQIYSLRSRIPRITVNDLKVLS